MSSQEIDTKAYFHFRKFAVKQDLCPLKVGTDAVLLGAWAEFPNAEKILDVGTGTGVIALMIAQRHKAYVKAIDINPIAVEQSADNFKNNLWANRMHSRHISVQELAYTMQKFDGIVCNPPFFTGCLPSPNGEKNQARHSDLVMPLKDLFASSANLLQPTGLLALVLPAELYEKSLNAASAHKLYPIRVLWVKTLADKPPKRVLLQFGFTTKEEQPDVNEISIEQLPDGSFYPEYQGLIDNYFLCKEERKMIFGERKRAVVSGEK